MTVAAKTGPSARHRVFLLDDHPLVREWLASMVALEPDLEVCGQADEANAALVAMPQARPDMVVVDLALPRSSGLEFIKEMRVQFPAVRLLVLSMHDEASVAEHAKRVVHVQDGTILSDVPVARQVRAGEVVADAS